MKKAFNLAPYPMVKFYQNFYSHRFTPWPHAAIPPTCYNTLWKHFAKSTVYSKGGWLSIKEFLAVNHGEEWYDPVHN